jgi:hypothetical protein
MGKLRFMRKARPAWRACSLWRDVETAEINHADHYSAVREISVHQFIQDYPLCPSKEPSGR